MAITKQNIKASGDIRFGYSEAGEVIGLLVPVSFQLIENGVVPPYIEAEPVKLINVWNKLTATQRAQIKSALTKVKELAEAEA